VVWIFQWDHLSGLLLVPATMRLPGRANWWAPPPLRRRYARYGIKEETAGPAPVPARTPG
jgi:uncharacterized membrane protein YdfJ with MMPL/SSD domain